MARTLGQVLPGVIVSTAGGCAAYLAGQLGRDRVRDVSEYLLERWRDNREVKPRFVRLTSAVGRPLRVAVQDSCQLRNGMGVWQESRALIAEVAELVELPSSGVCCGGAGTYSMLQPRMSRQILDPRYREAAELEVDVLVAVNPVCQRQLEHGKRRMGAGLRVMHLVELLAEALDE